MDVVGIVAEYNPFHAGHEYHLRRTKDMFPDSTLVCVMSGDFVQRGEPAVFSKYARAEAACRCGADLVVELPIAWSLASAEGFAGAALELLKALQASYISFGCECGEIEPLEKTARLLLNEGFIDEVKGAMRKNPELSFAAAREMCAEKHAIAPKGILRCANNILGVEYIKAIMRQGAQIIPVCIKREGNGHDAHGGSGFLSASEIRKRLGEGENITSLVPKNAAEVYLKEQGRGRILNCKAFETAVLSRLRMFDKEYFASLPDCSDGLGDRIYKAVRSSASLDGLFENAKTKRYAMSRVRRAVMCAATGVTAEMSAKNVPYIRILAANERGCALMRGEYALPVVSKAAQVRTLDGLSGQVFAVGECAHDLYTLCFDGETRGFCGEEWKTSPIIVKNSQISN